MKKVFLSLSALALLNFSCGDGAKEVESENEIEVVDQSTETTVEYSTVAEGSKVSWNASHLAGVGPHNGNIKVTDGNLKVTNGAVTNGNFVIDVTTLVNEDITEAEKRAKLEGHLKSADFLNAEKFPTASFEVASIKAAEGTYNSEITGNLTLKDSTRSVTFNANITITDEHVVIASEKFEIDRTQWGVHYGAEGTPNLTKDQVIANAVGIKVDVTIKK